MKKINNLLVISNAYASFENPANLIFVHNRTKQLGAYFNNVNVISRRRLSLVDFVLNLRSNLRRLRHNVYNYSFDGIEVSEIFYLTLFPENLLPINGLLYRRRFESLIREKVGKFTTVQLATWGDFSFLASICLHKLRIPYFASAIGNYENAYLSRPFTLNYLVLKYIYSKSSFVMCRSHELEHKIKVAFPDVDTFIFTSGVNLDLFKCGINRSQLRNKYNLGSEEVVILFTGRITMSKGIRELIDAFYGVKHELIDYKLKLLLVGPKHFKVERLVHDSNTWIIPEVSQNTLVDYLSIADIFVLPSYSEGLSNSLLEAMAMGLPTIATNVGHTNKIIINNYNGILISSRSVIEVKESLRKLVTDKDLRFRIGQNALATIRKNYNSDELGIELAKKINEVKCYT